MEIITFLSDFGKSDWFIAAVKGEILKINSAIKVIDITHAIKPQDIKSAAFVLKSVYENYPPGTVHLVVVDPGVGSKRRPIIIDKNPYYFVGPDNGVFSYIYDQSAKVYSIEVPNKVSTTFHGRDIFGPVAAQIASGDVSSILGREIHDFEKFDFPQVTSKGNRLVGEIVYIDHFGNLITNISNTHSIRGLNISGREVVVRKFYEEGKEGEIICLKGSSGYYEIACNKSNTSQLLNIAVGVKITADIQETDT